ncbi:prephenate dehydratase [Ornithinicoccus halotolerans]|uniref:prephenate dehydratase n=1 Tax=Ornithinicoccus halotolerans TaxID=1748220 RepID=UPI001297D529|nr:prephenate dehydratase [Ornithinicoccus halotolerans]
MTTAEPAGAAVTGYLGPAGTFTEQAARQLHPEEELWPAPSVAAALEAVRAGRLERAVVPFENSVEGSVSATLDELVRGDRLQIRAEAHVEVEFSVLARAGTSLGQVRRLATHPHAAAQTRGWVGTHLPAAEVVPESSTARAAALVAAGVYDAAIAAPLAGDRHRLEALAEQVADRPGAVTRFVEVGRPGPPPAPTGADTTTLVAYIRQNRPGALLELLEQFAVRGVDLTRLESRPTGEELGQYCFTIDAVGHLAEPRVAEALTGLRRTCAEVRFLGSYPRADGRVQPVDPEAGEEAYTEAQRWVAALRG